MGPESILIFLLLLVIGGLVAGGIFVFTKLQQSGVLSGNKPVVTSEEAMIMADSRAQAKIIEAEKEALEIRSKAKEEASRLHQDAERRERDLGDRDAKLIERAKSLDERFDLIDQKEKSLEQAKNDLKKMRDQLSVKLEEIAGLSKEEAEKQIRTQTEEELKSWVAKEVREAEKIAQRDGEEKTRDILVDIMQKSASDYVVETTTTTFDIPDEALKGKIIGKEGRNIRTFERLTGVDIIVDEAPNQVTISCFDPIRREVAAIALKKLLKDGRVHPTAIEAAIKNIKTELVKEIRKTGEEIAYDAGFPDLPEEIVMLLGRFKYRFSYGQNMVKHSLEMVNIGGQLAAEMGADVKLTKLACLLHDIGKVMTHEYEGKPHHHISGDVIRKYMRDEKLANAVEAHHGDIESTSLEAEIVKIADSISGSRPGARKDSYDEYIKRVTALESIAKQYESVAEAFAVQAGREVRVVVKSEETTDEDTRLLARNIAKEIEETQSYPGTVKVTVIRETRFVEEAK
jgi:ribonuclease Y